MSCYIAEDEILLQTYATGDPLTVHGNNKKFHYSEVFKLKRGSGKFPDPSFSYIEFAQDPSVDKIGNTYLSGQESKYGSSFFMVTPVGEKTFWKEPYNISNIRTLVASPRGSKIIFLYPADGTKYNDGKSAFGCFDIETSTWIPVDIPPIKSSTPIVIESVK
ncbi:MAG: hypothetical protein HQL87_02465 [Magnetococcales bacterium]|nr:hypothetical protein [Magnetococcales bacterium]